MSPRLVFATLLTVASTLFVVSAQSVRPAEPADAVAALVTELRAIRVDLAAASERGLRFQLLLARLQLQEQRIGHLDRQRAELVKTLMEATTASTMFTGQYEQMEKGCLNAGPDERRECEGRLAEMKVMVNTNQAREQQLRAQEQELLLSIGTEQGRWVDFSARLDELERAVSRPR